MNINTTFLSGKTSETLNTEILFSIASAKSLGKDIVKLSLKSAETETPEAIARRLNAATKILKSAKKSKLIQLFIYSADFDKESTELEYMKNKYGELISAKDESEYFLLKI
jgi:hypothetical protein